MQNVDKYEFIVDKNTSYPHLQTYKKSVWKSGKVLHILTLSYPHKECFPITLYTEKGTYQHDILLLIYLYNFKSKNNMDVLIRVKI